MAKKILVIDDEPDVLNFAVLRLQSFGYEVQTAPDYLAAREMIRRSLPDLILLDVMMPGKDGYEACNELKCDESTKNIPIILFTAKPPQKERLETNAEFVAADDYILKPFEPEVLLKKIKKLIG